MSGLKKHKDLVNIHRAHCFVYADSVTRNSATGLVVSDEGKVARQSDNDTWWVLTDASVDGSPVWKELTNETINPNTDVLVAVSATDTVSGYLDESVTTSQGSNSTLPIETQITSSGGDEKLNFQFDETKISITESQISDLTHTTDTFAKVEVDGSQQNTNAPTLDFDGSDFDLSESPADSFDITVKDSGIDHNATANYVAAEHTRWDLPGAGLIDASNYVDENDAVKASPNDTTPADLLAKLVAGTNITIQELNDGGNEQIKINSAASITASVATLQAERTTTQNITLTYADINYDTTHEQNMSSVIEKNAILTDRFDIKEDGQYLISYLHECDLQGDTTGYDFRVRINDSSVIPQSEVMMAHEHDKDPVAHTFNVELSAGDYLSFQIRQTSGSHQNSDLQRSHVSIVALRGAKGDTGATGAGSNIIVERDDVAIGTVTGTLNFEGVGVTSAIDEGSNKTTVTIAGGSGDYSDGGEAGGADRSIGNTDNFDLSFLTNNLERLVIHENGCLQADTSITGYLLDFHNKIASGGNGMILKAGEVSGDIVLHLADRDDTFQILEIEADQGHITHGKTYSQTLTDNGVVYGYDNQRTGDAADINTENGHYRIGGKPVAYGTEFADAESDGESSTTSTTEQVKVTLTTSSLPLGKYRVGWYFEINGSSGSQDVEVQVYDGATVLARVEEAAEDSDAWKSEGGFKYLSSISGVRTLTIKYKTQNPSATARIRRARLEIIRIS